MGRGCLERPVENSMKGPGSLGRSKVQLCSVLPGLLQGFWVRGANASVHAKLGGPGAYFPGI